MGLQAGMYSGVSGLQAHGEQMSVVGNNIANVSTLGYKGARMHFEDALSQEISTSSGLNQVGRGVQVGAVMKNMQQGSLESTTESTDVAIGGNGFFIVSPPAESTDYYTRAGNFRFDDDGYLVDPRGFRVQGWEIDQTATSGSSSGIPIIGSPLDVRLENFQSPPQETMEIDMVVNLNSDATEQTIDATNPFFGMYGAWDATAATPLGSSAYAYQSTIQTYDANGSPHNMTVYFDPVESGATISAGERVWEYMVTVSPAEDGRTLTSGDAKQGVLMIGNLVFDAAGNLNNMSAYTLNSTSASTALTEWEPAEINSDGLPVTTPNFLSIAAGDFTDQASAEEVALDFGMNFTGAAWSNTNAASTVGVAQANLATVPPASITLDALATTSYSTTGSYTIFQNQDGYGAGFLQGVSFDRNGVLTARYDNGQILDLYALTIADFNNRYGLRREGGNLFTESRESGPPLTSLAGVGGKGTVSSNSLEQSNVDLATEFVKMITSERGFQANSKVIRTTDGMLAELIALKR